jgi:hypothetical protein
MLSRLPHPDTVKISTKLMYLVLCVHVPHIYQTTYEARPRFHFVPLRAVIVVTCAMRWKVAAP